MSRHSTFLVKKTTIMAACDEAIRVSNEARAKARQDIIDDLMRPRWWRKAKTQVDAEKIADFKMTQSWFNGWNWRRATDMKNACKACCEETAILDSDDAEWVGRFTP